MITKFDQHEYWKHDNCRDVFVRVLSVVQDTGTVAILNVQWFTQGVERYWYTQQDRIRIKPSEYESWKPYGPKGTYY